MQGGGEGKVEKGSVCIYGGGGGGGGGSCSKQESKVGMGWGPARVEWAQEEEEEDDWTKGN